MLEKLGDPFTRIMPPGCAPAGSTASQYAEKGGHASGGHAWRRLIVGPYPSGCGSRLWARGCLRGHGTCREETQIGAPVTGRSACTICAHQRCR